MSNSSPKILKSPFWHVFGLGTMVMMVRTCLNLTSNTMDWSVSKMVSNQKDHRSFILFTQKRPKFMYKFTSTMVQNSVFELVRELYFLPRDVSKGGQNFLSVSEGGSSHYLCKGVLYKKTHIKISANSSIYILP